MPNSNILLGRLYYLFLCKIVAKEKLFRKPSTPGQFSVNNVEGHGIKKVI